MASKIPEKAFNLIRNMPRVKLNSLKPIPGEYTIGKKRRRNRKSGLKSGRGDKGAGQKMRLPRLGFEGGNPPFYLRIPKEPYYKGHHLRREYPPLTLLELQRLIDLGRIDPDQPIDLTTICNTFLYKIDPKDGEYGVNLTDEGAELFKAKINIEVQWAEESTIAAIERNGGMITTRYFSIECVQALCNPLKFFAKGIPIPRCPLPPMDAFEYYTNPDFRGYLANPEKVKESRYKLAQKYGYEMPKYDEDPKKELFQFKKDPRQIYFGLSPGWIISLKDKVIIKPKDKKYVKFYRS